jgi:hypothetical protein
LNGSDAFRYLLEREGGTQGRLGLLDSHRCEG